MKKHTFNQFFMSFIRFLLQMLGTYFVLRWAWKEAIAIPLETWGMVALLTVIVVVLIVVWIKTIIGFLKSRKNKSDY